LKKQVAVLVVIVAVVAVFAIPSVRYTLLGVPLRFNYKVGQQSSYKMSADGKVKLDVQGLPPQANPMMQAFIGKDIPFKVSLNYKQLVKSVDASGVAEVETSFDGGDFEVTTPAGPPIKRPLDKQPSTVMKVDARGKPVDVKAPPGMTAEQAKQMQDVFSNMFLGFLTGDTRRPGQSWQQPVNFTLPNPQVKFTVGGSVTDHFDKVTTRNKETAADIHGNYNITLDLAPAQPQPGLDVTMKGSIKGDSDTYFDWQNACVAGVDGNATIDVTLVTKATSPQPVNTTAHLTGSMKAVVDKQ
jgi:hypothetical protein